MNTEEQLLYALNEYELDSVSELISTALISTVVFDTGTTYRITLSATISSVSVGNFILIPFGRNGGMYEIKAVGSNYVDVQSDVALLNIPGECSFYNVKIRSISYAISDAILLAERITRTSFQSEVSITELHDGHGTNEIILNRRPIKSVESISLSGGFGVFVYDPVNYNISTDRSIISFADPLVYFPKGDNNIVVNYTYGYASLPSDVQRAVVLLAMVSILSDSASFSGGLTGRSIVAYSESYTGSGKYSNIRKRHTANAVSILNKYKSGMV